MYELVRVKDILNDLDSGARKAADLSGDEFQYAVLHRLISHLQEHEGLSEYSLIDAHQGEVDFIVRIKRNNRSSMDNPEGEIYMFECKNYGRNLELDTVAKTFLVGIRRRPSLLAIVARTSLQPQAIEFAHAIFPKYRQSDPNALAPGTVFRFFKTDELVEIDLNTGPLPSAGLIPAKEGTSSSEPLIIRDWSFYEYRPFTEAILARQNGGTNHASLAAGSSYRLDLVVRSSHGYVDADAVVDRLPEGVEAVVRIQELATLSLNLKEIAISVALTVASGVKGGPCKPILHLAHGPQMNETVMLPLTLSLNQSSHSLPELRQRQLDDSRDELVAGDARRIVFLSGPAGVGKTHFCEQLAMSLRSRYGFDIHRFTIDNQQNAILWSILSTVMTPPAARTDKILHISTPWEDLASLLVEQASSDPGSDGKSIPSPELIIPILLRLLSHSEKRLLVFRDAHAMMEAAANQLSTLINALEDIGWGSIHILFEHRTGDKSGTPIWEKFSNELSCRSNSVRFIDLTPLSIRELSESLDIIFEEITENIKGQIFSITNGYPLYLENLFSVLQRSKTIAPGPMEQLVILKPSDFENPDLTFERGHAILLKKISGIRWPVSHIANSKLDIPSAMFLGFVAVANSSNRIEALCALLEVPPADFKKFKRTIENEGLILPSLSPYQVTFKHALLQADCAALLDSLPEAKPLIDDLLDLIEVEKRSLLEQELCSDLAAAARLDGEALRLIRPVAERWRSADDFEAQCRIFGKLCDRLTALEPLTEANQHLLAEARNALGWAMWNAGSCSEAIDLFDLAKRESLQIPDDTQRRELNSGDALRRIVGLELELERPRRMISAAEEALKSRLHWLHYNSVMNRLVLGSSQLCFPTLALRFARILLDTFGDVDNPESPGAVLCSDLGGIYRALYPALSLSFYEKALEYTRDPRQSLYSRMDLAITQALLDPTDAAEQRLFEIREEIVKAGLTQMLTRMDLTQGGLALSRGRAASGRIMIDRALTSIGVYRRTALRISALNDSMVAALVQEDLHIAERRASTLLAALREKIAERQPLYQDLGNLVEGAENARQRFRSTLSALPLRLPDEIPAYSGMWLQALMNLASVSDVLLPEDERARAKSLWPDDLNRELCEKLSTGSGLLDVRWRGLHLRLCGH